MGRQLVLQCLAAAGFLLLLASAGAQHKPPLPGYASSMQAIIDSRTNSDMTLEQLSACQMDPDCVSPVAEQLLGSLDQQPVGNASDLVINAGGAGETVSQR
eukprot:scaffold10169_cov25-Prasinocladus_malaysianus.AAC.1